MYTKTAKSGRKYGVSVPEWKKSCLPVRRYGLKAIPEVRSYGQINAKFLAAAVFFRFSTIGLAVVVAIMFWLLVNGEGVGLPGIAAAFLYYVCGFWGQSPIPANVDEVVSGGVTEEELTDVMRHEFVGHLPAAFIGAVIRVVVVIVGLGLFEKAFGDSEVIDRVVIYFIGLWALHFCDIVSHVQAFCKIRALYELPFRSHHS